MRKISFILLTTVAMLTSFYSCKSDKAGDNQEIHIREAEMILSPSDTTEVMMLVNQFLENVKANDIDAAISMLYYLDKDQITELPPNLEKKERATLSLRGISYDIEDIRFLRETDSQVRYTVTLFERKSADNRPNKVSFVIKPVRRNKQWYLTLADSETSNYNQIPSGTEIQN